MPSARRILTAALLSAVALLALPAFASAASLLTPDSGSVNFPDADIHGEAPSETVKIHNEGDEAAEIVSIDTGGGAFALSPGSECFVGAVVAAGENCALNVTFDPALAGEDEATVEIGYEDGSGPNETKFTVVGHGWTGTVAASAPTWNTQPYFYGSQEQQVNVFDSSLWRVQLGAVSIAGPDSGAFSLSNGCAEGQVLWFSSCSIYVTFSPTHPGDYEAQLEIANDGTEDPFVLPLEVTALEGPAVSIDPSSVDFGPVEVGQSAPDELVTIENAGDSPLQVQQLLIISGTPQIFPVTEDGCSLQIMFPGDTCEVTVGFSPTKAGERSASIFVISNSGGPVTTAALSGEGVYAPDGTVSLTSTAKAGVPIYCLPHGYHETDELSFQWVTGGQAIPGATDSIYIPTTADVGSTVACELTAENAVGDQTITSAASATIAAGEAGPVGPAGPSGPTGPAGPAGPQGDQGEPGAAGQQGAQGQTGPQGALGATGADGSTGANGASGATGPQGPAGAKGAKGPKGATGAKGERGPAGPSGNRKKKRHHKKHKAGHGKSSAR